MHAALVGERAATPVSSIAFPNSPVPASVPVRAKEAAVAVRPERTMDLMDANWLEQLQIIGTVIVAAVLGGIVGMERELSDRPAGLRTHAILAAAAALLVGLADPLLSDFVSEAPPSVLRADPMRIVEAVVTGTAFLGAGTIFRDRDRGAVEGLTTAASLLMVAAIGIAVALEQLVIAVSVSLLALILLRMSRWLPPRRTKRR